MSDRLHIGDIIRLNGREYVVILIHTCHGLLHARIAQVNDWRQCEVQARPIREGEVIGRNLRHAIRAWLAAAGDSHGYMKRARLARTKAIWRHEAEQRMSKANRIERLWHRLQTASGGAT